MAAYRRRTLRRRAPATSWPTDPCVDVLEDPKHASPMSPLFLHGDCGVGKPHLLQGMCERASTQFQSHPVLLAEQFTNEYIRARPRTRPWATFRQQLRTLDLLAIDDVHFFSHKEGTQNEFLHMLDACLLHGTKLCCSLEMGTPIASSFFTGVEFSLCLGHGGAHRITGREHPFGHRQPLGEPPRVAS